VARFLARFASLGFTVAPETQVLLREMVASGEVDALVPERVWRELERALAETHPRAAIELLRDCGALRVLMPELNALFGVPQHPQWHPEIDTGEHALLALQMAADRAASTAVRFAVLVHDLGKACTPREQWPSHIDHERLGLDPIETLCERWRVPQESRELALLTCRFHTRIHRALELRPGTLLEILEESDAFRRPERFRELLEACECDARGRQGLTARPYPQRARLEAAFAAASAVTLSSADRRGLEGPAIGAKLRTRRLEAIHSV
jgi:tRNA nucleotidyltransferase (CCA-adding enzyme)